MPAEATVNIAVARLTKRNSLAGCHYQVGNSEANECLMEYLAGRSIIAKEGARKFLLLA